jgi:cellulose synthase/poly-beta-1,6-N-acetylglucosamine synthase-like glycosyltransferase
LNLKTASLLFGLYTTVNTLAYAYARKQAFNVQKPPKPQKTATVAVTIWNEPKTLVTQCFNSIRAQTALIHYPEMFEVIAVNGSGVEWASPYADRILHAKRGKLNARNLAFHEAKGEIVVFVDADVMLPPASLSLILEPFRNPQVVAVTSTTDQGLKETFLHLPSLAFWWNHKLTGRFCAIKKDAYFKAGGFNPNIPQQDIAALQYEEEFAFMRRLEEIGKTVLRDIPVIHLGQGRRGLHSLGDLPLLYPEQRG